MSNTVLKIENVSKQYRLGLIGTGTISHDINRWLHKIRGKEDPYIKIGELNNRKISGGEYVWALRNINIDVNKGDILGLIGKNGAGKSTLLKLLSQVTNPTIGSIKVKGRIASLLEIGTGFHPELTGRENIFLNGAILGMKKSDIVGKLDEIIDFSGVSKYIDTPVKRYSSGMMVRLGFAVAAHLDPEILVVDEVLAVGDAEFQKKCLGKMKDVASEGRTVIFVSHNMSSIRNLCSKGIVLENGNVSFTGKTHEAISFYLNKKKKDDLKISHNINPNLSTNNTGEAKFKTAFITNTKNEYPVVRLSYQEKFKIISSIDIFKPIKNISISINILNEYGETVAYAYYANNRKLLEFNPGKYLISLDSPVILMPGNYALGLSIYNFYTGSSIDHVEYFYPFKVDKVTENKENEYPWETIHGYVEMNNKWKIVNIN